MILENGPLCTPDISSLTTMVLKTGFTDTAWMLLADRFIAISLIAKPLGSQWLAVKNAFVLTEPPGSALLYCRFSARRSWRCSACI